MSINKLPTRGNLVSRGVDVLSSLYLTCEIDIENYSRLFFSCFLAMDFRCQVLWWWSINATSLTSVLWQWISQWLYWFNPHRLSAIMNIFLEGTFYASLWHIWSFKNIRLFAIIKLMAVNLFDRFVT